MTRKYRTLDFSQAEVMRDEIVSMAEYAGDDDAYTIVPGLLLALKLYLEKMEDGAFAEAMDFLEEASNG